MGAAPGISYDTRGGIVGMIGPNGAGKTTLFRMITGEEKPDSGALRVGETVRLAYVERIRRAGVTIVIEDRLPPRRTLEVRPVIYKGERIDALSEIPVAGRPPIKAELYLVARDEEGEKAGAERPVIALYRLGTRVCRDISELPEFAREPWSAGSIEGALDYADFQLSPTSVVTSWARRSSPARRQAAVGPA